jgi:hypothetical protein
MAETKPIQIFLCHASEERKCSGRLLLVREHGRLSRTSRGEPTRTSASLNLCPTVPVTVPAMGSN